MDFIGLLTILASCLQPAWARMTETATHMYTDVGIKDRAVAHQVLFEVPARNAPHCAVLCNRQDNCLTFTFAAGTCRGHSTFVTSCTALTSAPGAKSFALKKEGDTINEPCCSDADCRPTENVSCFKNTCLCKPGFYLSESRLNGTCLETCPSWKLAQSFTAYPNSSIMFNNLDSFFSSSAKECQEKCLQRGSECRSIDSGWSCNLQDATPLTAASAWDPADSGWVYYQRNCL